MESETKKIKECNNKELFPHLCSYREICSIWNRHFFIFFCRWRFWWHCTLIIKFLFSVYFTIKTLLYFFSNLPKPSKWKTLYTEAEQNPSHWRSHLELWISNFLMFLSLWKYCDQIEESWHYLLNDNYYSTWQIM